MYGQGAFSSGTNAYSFVKFPVTMRIAPTSMDYSNVAYYDYSGVYALSTYVLSSAETSKEYASTQVGLASGGVQYRPIFTLANATTSSYVGFSAEL